MDDYDVLGGAIPRPAKDKVVEGDDVDEGSDAPQPDAPRRRDWSDEEKAWIVHESLERGTTVEEVAERHGGTVSAAFVLAQVGSQGRVRGSPGGAERGTVCHR